MSVQLILFPGAAIDSVSYVIFRSSYNFLFICFATLILNTLSFYWKAVTFAMTTSSYILIKFDLEYFIYIIHADYIAI